MAVANIALTTARASWLLGARADGAVFNNTIADDRYAQEEYLRAAVETESELVRALAEAYHPARTDFLAWSLDLAHGDNLPIHLGQVEAVQIEKYTGEGAYHPGLQTTRHNIIQWRENYNSIFDAIAHNANGSTLSGYFHIRNQTILFTGAQAQVKVVTFDPDFSGAPVHQIEEQWENALVCGMIPKLYKDGTDPRIVDHYSRQFQQVLTQIYSGLKAMPEIDMASKVE